MKIVITTTNSENAERIKEVLLKERLAACVSSFEVNSAYWWEGKIVEDKERLLLIKTRSDLAHKVANRIKEIHAYDVPEIIVLNVDQENQKYEKWLNNVTASRF